MDTRDMGTRDMGTPPRGRKTTLIAAVAQRLEDVFAARLAGFTTDARKPAPPQRLALTCH